MKTLGLVLLALVMPASWAAEIPPATVVRFNTVCANCHEGECSGRLSFQSGAAAATNHIRRYLAAPSEREMLDLFALLKYTKEQCSHYPLKPAVPANGRWVADDLAYWRNHSEGGYFIPLGNLKAGKYSLRLTFAAAPQGRARVSDARFEVAAEEPLCGSNDPVIRFEASGREYYLHLQGQAELLGLELQRQR